jgi:putative hydrolase of the HAD superfamily
VRHLLADFGGVVLLTPFELLHLAEDALGVARGTFDWGGPFDPERDEAWREVEAGRRSERDYWASRVAEAAARTGRDDLDVRSFFAHCYDATWESLVRPEVVGLIRRVRRAGRRVGILTNDMEAFHGAAWVARMGILREVDAVVDGSRTGVLKPDRRAFELALEALGTAAPDTVFVDDQPVNVAAAAAVGLVTVRFDPTDVDGSVAAVEAALGGRTP